MDQQRKSAAIDKNRSGINKWGVLLTIQVGAFTVILNNSLMNVALPYFMSFYYISAVQAQWTVTIFALGMALTMPLTGYLGGRLGPKRVFLLGVALFICSSIIGATAGNFNFIVLSRLFQGLSGGLIMPLSMILIFKHFARRERGLAMGIWGISAMVAPAIGPTLGGFILSYFSWPMLFIINIPTSLIALVAASYFLKGRDKSEKLPFDKIGFILISIGIIFLIIGIDLVQNMTSFLLTFSFLAIGSLSFVFFIKYELRLKKPLLNLKVFKNKVFTAGLILSSCSTMSFFTVLILIPLLIQEVLLESPLQTGLILFPQAIAVGIAMTIGGRLLDKRGSFIVLFSGTLLLGIAMLTLSIMIGTVPIWFIVVLLVFQGIGNGFINAPSATAALNALPPKSVNDGAALINVLRQFMKIFAVVLITIVFEWRRGVYEMLLPELDAGIMAIKQGFAVVGIVLILILPMIVMLRKRLI